jgi:hypothetical protein
MTKRIPYLFCLLTLTILMFAPAVKADVPFPQDSTTYLTQDIASSADTAIPQNTQTAAVNKTSLPIDPTLFAAVVGISGLILGSLITLAGVAVTNSLNKRRYATRKEQEEEMPLHQAE